MEIREHQEQGKVYWMNNWMDNYFKDKVQLAKGSYEKRQQLLDNLKCRCQMHSHQQNL